MSGGSRDNRRLKPQTAFSRFSPVHGANRECLLRVECGRPSPGFLESAAQQEVALTRA
jgi:hypothetical protein